MVSVSVLNLGSELVACHQEKGGGDRRKSYLRNFVVVPIQKKGKTLVTPGVSFPTDVPTVATIVRVSGTWYVGTPGQEVVGGVPVGQ